jgi:hypothetical protein
MHIDKAIEVLKGMKQHGISHIVLADWSCIHDKMQNMIDYEKRQDKTFTVRVRRVSVAQIEVKASDTSSAENKVDEMLSNGDLPDLQWEINLEKIESVIEL